MTNTVAIDFGTSRTKLAYVNARGEARVMRPEEERAWASLFYLAPQSDDVMWGYDAAAMLEDDPGGVVETLKRKLQATKVRANGRGVEPQDLLNRLFAALRTQAGQSILDFAGEPPAAVKLTVPVLYGPPIERVMRTAATAAGFDDIELITEPVAAARAWAAEAGSDAQDVIVFDAGGGTIDWAWLRREGGEFRVVPECPPGGDKDVGGHHLDEGLLELVKDALDLAGAADAAEHVERERVRWLAKVRGIKEQFSRGAPIAPLRVRGRAITLSAADVEKEIDRRFTNQSCEWLASYLHKVRALAPKTQPTILLVGGSARLKGLKGALQSRLGCPASWWERSEYATVLGAVLGTVEKDELASESQNTQFPDKVSSSREHPKNSSPCRVLVPSLGESTPGATVAKWYKEDGDVVHRGDTLVELETDKVTVEIEAEVDGKLQVIKSIGEDVPVGAIVALIHTNLSEGDDILSHGDASKYSHINMEEVLMPAMSPTMTEGRIAKWIADIGEYIQIGDIICTVETDKTAMDVEATSAGTQSQILIPEGTEGVQVNQPIAILLVDR